MKITKRQLKRIIKEERARLSETNQGVDSYSVMVDEIVTSLRKGRSYPDGYRLPTEDEVFIKLGAGHENGITVKVLRRGK